MSVNVPNTLQDCKVFCICQEPVTPLIVKLPKLPEITLPSPTFKSYHFLIISVLVAAKFSVQFVNKVAAAKVFVPGLHETVPPAVIKNVVPTLETVIAPLLISKVPLMDKPAVLLTVKLLLLPILRVAPV